MSRNNNDDSDDPYDQLVQNQQQNTLSEIKQESARQRKWNKLKQKFATVQVQATQGFIMGGLCGGAFGAIFGIWEAIKSRRLLIIPLSALMSGLSFGFILACGSVIRSDDQNINYQNTLIQQQIPQYSQFQINHYWKIKYALPSQQNYQNEEIEKSE